MPEELAEEIRHCIEDGPAEWLKGKPCQDCAHAIANAIRLAQAELLRKIVAYRSKEKGFISFDLLEEMADAIEKGTP